MGADYEKSHRQQLFLSPGAQTNVNQTRYIAFGGGALHATELRAQTYINIPGVFRGLRAHSQNAPGVGETYTYTLMVNGLATALTCQTVNPNTESDDLVNAVGVAPGDRVSLRIVTSLNAVISFHTIGMELTQ